MIHMTLAKAATILGLNPVQAEKEFHGISIDTRTLQPGNLFIAIPGEKVDGHDYISEACAKGAVALLVSRPVESDLPQLVVDDTTLALGKLGAAWRQQFVIPFIAITGSNGKTTVKNMVSSILIAACQDQASHVLATLGTLNNHWGLPLTLARLNAQHRYAAIEMGMNHFGEIDYLTRLTQPNIAMITNAAAAHLQGLGDVAGVAKAKGEIFNGLTSDGIAILNRDDAFYDYWLTLLAGRATLTFGLHPEADITGTFDHHSDHFVLRTPKGETTIHLPLLGKHNFLNALAATAATQALGISLATIKKGLESMQPAPGRLQLRVLDNGVKIIDDTYNANPFSLQAAIHTLATFAGKKILVLGDMKELGLDEKNIHHSAGLSIRQAGIDFLFTYGELSASTAQSFGEGAYHFNEQEKLITALKPFLYNTTTILVKGSRSMKMEKVIAGLVNE